MLRDFSCKEISFLFVFHTLQYEVGSSLASLCLQPKAIIQTRLKKSLRIAS
jgi:hypothetical protein